jgi:hypothetical protein
VREYSTGKLPAKHSDSSGSVLVPEPDARDQVRATSSFLRGLRRVARDERAAQLFSRAPASYVPIRQANFLRHVIDQVSARIFFPRHFRFDLRYGRWPLRAGCFVVVISELFLLSLLHEPHAHDGRGLRRLSSRKPRAARHTAIPQAVEAKMFYGTFDRRSSVDFSSKSRRVDRHGLGSGRVVALGCRGLGVVVAPRDLEDHSRRRVIVNHSPRSFAVAFRTQP